MITTQCGESGVFLGRERFVIRIDVVVKYLPQFLVGLRRPTRIPRRVLWLFLRLFGGMRHRVGRKRWVVQSYITIRSLNVYIVSARKVLSLS